MEVVIFNDLWPMVLTGVGICLVLSGSLGQCASAHSLHSPERRKEIWTAQ